MNESNCLELIKKYINKNYTLFKSFIQLNFFIFIIIQLFYLFLDFYTYRFLIPHLPVTEYRYGLVGILFITLLLAYIIYKERIILAFILILFLEALGFYLLKNSINMGYVTHLVILLSLLYIGINERFKGFLNSFINIFSLKYLFVIALVLYFLMYLFLDGFDGWLFRGADQNAYRGMVQRIVSGDWFYGGYTGGFLYPLGYPLLGSVGYFFYKDNPFFLVNIIIYTIMLITIYYSVNRYSNKAFAIVAFLLLALQTPILNINDWYMKSMIFPFNNVVSFLASSVILYYLFIDRLLNKKELFLVSFVVSLVLLSRYGDVVFFLLPLLYIVLKKSSVNVYKSILISGIPLIVTLVGILYAHNLFYGDPFTVYHHFTGKHDFWFHPFAFNVNFYKFMEMFFFPFMSTNPSYSSFLLPMVYVIFLPFGVYYLWKNKRIETILLLTIMLSNIWYFSAADAVNSGNIRVDAFRYFGVSVPIIIFLSLVGIYYLSIVNKKTFRFSNLVKVVVLVLMLSIISNKKDIKEHIHSLVQYDYDIEFVGLKDSVKATPYPNYGSDGVEDLQFKITIDSLVPVHLLHVSVIDPNNKEFISQEYLKSELKGIGIVNEYGYDVKLGWGDNNYKNNYLDGKKEIVLSIPNSIDNKIPFGKYIFNVKTTKAKIQKEFILNE